MIKSKITNLLKIIKIEFKIQITPINCFIALFLAFIPMINPMASNPNDYQTIRETWSFLGRVFTEALIYAMVIRLNSVIKDRFSIDKNRAEYIVFPKTLVLIAKILVDSILFLITIIATIAGGILVVKFWKDGKFSSDFIYNVFSFVVVITAFYLFIATGLMSIVSSKMKNQNKVLIGIIWVLLTVITYIALSISIGVVKIEDSKTTFPNGTTITNYKYPVNDFFYNNHQWISFVPFINFGIIAMVLYGFVEWYWMVPITIYFLIFIAIISRKLSTNFKEYLTI